MNLFSTHVKAYFSAYYYLGVDILIVILQAMSIAGNGFILTLFVT